MAQEWDGDHSRNSPIDLLGSTRSHDLRGAAESWLSINPTSHLPTPQLLCLTSVLRQAVEHFRVANDFVLQVSGIMTLIPADRAALLAKGSIRSARWMSTGGRIEREA